MEHPQWYRGRSHELKARLSSTGLSFPFCKITGFWTGSVVPTSSSAPETLKKIQMRTVQLIPSESRLGARNSLFLQGH